jgi:PAS domain S-box-containing protein
MPPRPRVSPTGKEVTFGRDEIIVSKTDRTGRITYANQVFVRVSGYTEEELLGAPHSILRHPAMPRVVFAVLWETIQAGQEVFAYVLNLARNGDEYWVFAHVTPTFGPREEIIGFHSNRRTPERGPVREMSKVYETLRDLEQRAGRGNDIAASRAALLEMLAARRTTWNELMFSL